MKVLHGDNIVESRAALTKLIAAAKEKDMEVVMFEGKKWELVDLIQALEANSLFGQDRLVVIEKWLGSLNARSKSDVLDYLGKSAFENLVIWDDKKVTAGLVKKLKNAKAQEYKLPSILFTFLDSIGVEKDNKLLGMLHELCKQQPAEMVLAMFTRRVRQLLLLSEGEHVLLEAERLQGWQVGKLKKQLRNLSKEKLRGLYEDLVEYDYERKTSRNVRDVSAQMEWWLVSLAR